MDLSVIIVNWNTVTLLRNCLYTVYEKVSDISFEVIVVDNASEDDSAAMVRDQFPEANLIVNDSNLGFASANNIGIMASKGRHILLLNSDTLVLDDVIQNSVAYLDQNKNCAAMGCKVLNQDCTIQPSTSLFPGVKPLILQTLGLDRLGFLPALQRYRVKNIDPAAVNRVETISGCYLMVKKAVIDQIGGLDEDFFFFGEETDWCERLRQHGHELHYAPVGQIIHLGGGSSRPLKYTRDLMLTQATVRLHRKHKGLWSALLVFLILWLFNASRWGYWAVHSWLKGSYKAADRSQHFKNICRDYHTVWPSNEGAGS